MIELTADKLTISGPKVDGGYKVTFDVGEDFQKQVVQCMAIPQQTPITVTITI